MAEMADKTSHVRKKRQPQRKLKRRNDIYVNRKTDFAAHLERCQKSLDSSEQEVIIHGLGAAINRAMNLALQLEHKGQGTVEDHEGYSKVRTNSAIHIRVYKKPLTPI
ncbi:ribonuclease P protein subunit p20-like isoform X2 [Montipora foliosa]|uniref:ribonuclease P protein subunit p20-like isoform X2 n=1 Tax=Montipora foliosa TaxID=591990 RepID=UPI0035F18390